MNILDATYSGLLINYSNVKEINPEKDRFDRTIAKLTFLNDSELMVKIPFDSEILLKKQVLTIDDDKIPCDNVSNIYFIEFNSRINYKNEFKFNQSFIINYSDSISIIDDNEVILKWLSLIIKENIFIRNL